MRTAGRSTRPLAGTVAPGKTAGGLIESLAALLACNGLSTITSVDAVQLTRSALARQGISVEEASAVHPICRMA